MQSPTPTMPPNEKRRDHMKETIWVTQMPMGRTAGICASDTPELGIRAVGDYFLSGLKLGQKVALIGSDDVSENLRNFKRQGFDFLREIDDGRMNYLFYKSHLFPVKNKEESAFPFQEIQSLCDVDVARIAILDIDRLFATDDAGVLSAQIKQFMLMCTRLPYTVLGQFTVRPHAHVQRLLAEVRDHESFIHITARRRR